MKKNKHIKTSEAPILLPRVGAQYRRDHDALGEMIIKITRSDQERVGYRNVKSLYLPGHRNTMTPERFLRSIELGGWVKISS